MKIEKIDPVKCSKCGSIQMKNVGWRKIDGYLCRPCSLYHKKNGEVKEVEFIHMRSKNFIFENDLTFIKDHK